MLTKQSESYWLLLLLTVVCLPRVSIDLYLPVLPALGHSLHATPGALQATLSLYMAGYALSMLLCGPLADRLGRRPVLLGGTTLYLLATLLCACADTIGAVMAGRLLQALGGCCGTVVGRVMVKDRYDQDEQLRLLSLLSAGMALAPVLAPVPGGLIGEYWGWRWCFGALALVALLLLPALWRLPETRPQTGERAPPAVWSGWRRLLSERHFLRCTLTISFGYCTYFAYVSASPSLLQTGMHLGATAYAWLFSLSVPGYLLGTRLMHRLARSRSVARVLDLAIALNLCACLLLCASTAWLPRSPWALVGPMIPVMLSVGMLIPACQLLVLQPYAAMAGTASGLFFAVQMLAAALCAWLVGLLPIGGAAPLGGLILCASIGTAWAWHGLSVGMPAPRRCGGALSPDER